MQCFYCHFSYYALLELKYGSKWQKSLAAKEQVRNGGMSVCKAEHCMDVEMFLDEYPWWQVGGLHHPIILQGMFVQAVELGQNEAERLIYHG